VGKKLKKVRRNIQVLMAVQNVGINGEERSGLGRLFQTSRVANGKKQQPEVEHWGLFPEDVLSYLLS